MTCGIYLGSPKHIITDKVYIGQSVNIEDRIRRHNSDMRSGVHKKKVQSAYNMYGEFEWEILKECAQEELHNFEKYYIQVFNACTDGFNTYEDSISAPILYGVDNGKVDKESIPVYLRILKLTIEYPTYSRHKIAELAQTEEHVVSHIWYGHSCKWLGEMFPVEYTKVTELLGTRQMGGKTAEQQGIVYPSLLSPDLQEYTVHSIREFAREHDLDIADLSNVVNMKKPSVKGWIVKDLDQLNPEVHDKFNSTNRGYYKKQFNLYKAE